MPQSPVPVFETTDKLPADAPVIVVLQVAEGDLGTGAATLDAEMGGMISRACSGSNALTENGTCFDLVPPQGMNARRVIVLALGKADGMTALSLTRAGGALAAHLEGKGENEATLVFDAVAGVHLTEAEVLARVALGMRLRRYRFDLRNKRPKAAADQAWRVRLVTANKAELNAELIRTVAIADGVEYARTLVNLPPNHLHPDSFADHLEPLRQAGIEVEVLDAAQLKKLGMNALLAVGAGSVRAPKVAVLQYRGKNADAHPLAFVGKGVCFDSGGLCIKGGAQMFDMKADMAGAAAVCGLMLALARQGSPVHAVGVLKHVAFNWPHIRQL